MASIRWNVLPCLRFACTMCFCHSYLRSIRGKEAYPDNIRALLCWRTQLDGSESFLVVHVSRGPQLYRPSSSSITQLHYLIRPVSQAAPVEVHLEGW